MTILPPNLGFECYRGSWNIAKESFSSYDPKSLILDLELGFSFDDGKQFKEAMVDYVVHTKRDIWFNKNEPKRVRVLCASTCPFSMHFQLWAKIEMFPSEDFVQ